MRKLPAGIVSVPVWAALLFCASCGSDDGIATIEFLSSTGTVTEGFSYTLYYNRSLPQGAETQVAFDGTLQTDEFTYQLIPAGVYITVIDDEVYDPGDTLIVTLTGITGPAKLGGKQTMTLRVKDYDEDARPGLRVELTWDAGNGSAGDVDMDLFLWRENPPGSSNFELVASAVQIGNVFEALSVRNESALFPDGVYGVGYNYFSGTANPLNFTVKFRAQKGTINNDSIVARFNGTYTLANLNRWDQTSSFHVAQTFVKSGNNFHSFSPLDVPPSGSRMKGYTFTPFSLRKGR
ncbi:MAG: hypothetical protein KatS3mg032_1456 [Cyclobacteriaceae bacterium]|nr:MAG: hypothetical protein KatS3mg032_1456 [Cyclobacteriaceae bacterium]